MKNLICVYALTLFFACEKEATTISNAPKHASEWRVKSETYSNSSRRVKTMNENNISMREYEYYE